MQEQNDTPEAEQVENIDPNRVYADLAKALKQHDDKVRRNIQKLSDPHSGKPSRKGLFTIFSSLYELIMTTSQVERVTMGHINNLAIQTMNQMRALILYLEEKNLLDKDRLREITEDMLESDKKRMDEAMGLVNRVVPVDELEDEGWLWAQEILDKSPLAIRLLKSSFNAAVDGQAGLQELAGNATLLFYMTEQAQEAKDAFLEKRKPDFRKYPWLPW